jgi:hypothetical protein
MAPDGAIHGLDIVDNFLLDHLTMGFDVGFSHGSSPISAAQVDSTYKGTSLRFGPGGAPAMALNDLRLQLLLGARFPVNKFVFSAGSGIAGDMLISKVQGGDPTNDSLLNGMLSFPIWARADVKPVCELTAGALISYNFTAVGAFSYEDRRLRGLRDEGTALGRKALGEEARFTRH